MFKPKGVIFLTLVIMLVAFSCSGPESDQTLLTAKLPLHLEEHIEAAMIEGSEVPEDLPAPVEWRFDEPHPDWKPAKPISAQWEAVKPVRVDDALRLPLTAECRADGRRLIGIIYVDLPDWNFEEWGYVEIRARAQDSMRNIGLAFNYTKEDSEDVLPFYAAGAGALLVTDGTVQTYRLSLHTTEMRKWEGPWTHLGIRFTSRVNEEAAKLDILSIRLVPRATIYADSQVGVREIIMGKRFRRALYTHAPGRLKYRLRVPKIGRLDMGLGVVRSDIPVTFRVYVTTAAGNYEKMFEETFADPFGWQQRSVDLASYAGYEITLALETEAEENGTVAFWGAPTLSGSISEASTAARKPNVIFYVIDGGAAEAMTVYGYNRNTTPNIKRLAEQGAVFEYAYSNSSWTDPSTISFMTSLLCSVLLKTGGRFNLAPPEALTMAQRFHNAGYMTGVFTSNPWAGSDNDLQRGVDWFRDEGVNPPSVSTIYLHSEFWEWREAYPGSPFWVHFQTTDVHNPKEPLVPFAGLFVTPERHKQLHKEQERMRDWIKANPRGNGPRVLWSNMWEDLGIDRVDFYTTRRNLYDEVMAHQDYQLGRFVERLKANGDWENTVLVIAADHAYRAGSDDFGLVLQDSLPEQWAAWGPLFRSTISRVPLIVVWPGHIEAGRRFTEPVSMIDVLPTLLELTGLPAPEVFQGQSLAPLLLGTGPIERRPVIFDYFETNRRRELHGLLEVVDGRWGASLAINSGFANPNNPEDLRPEPLLIYDVWEDPLGLRPINDERPDLVKKYTKFLEAQREMHHALAQHFTQGGKVKLTPEQLKTLRSLGYIR